MTFSCLRGHGRILLVSMASSLVASAGACGGGVPYAVVSELDLGYSVHAGSEVDGHQRLANGEAIFSFQDQRLKGVWTLTDAESAHSFVLTIDGVEDETDYALDDMQAKLCACNGQLEDSLADDPTCVDASGPIEWECFDLDGLLRVNQLDEHCDDSNCQYDLDARVTVRSDDLDLDLTLVQEVEYSHPQSDCGVGGFGQGAP